MVDSLLCSKAWMQAYINSPITHLHMDEQSSDDEWAMWNNGGEL